MNYQIAYNQKNSEWFARGKYWGIEKNPMNAYQWKSRYPYKQH